MYRSPARERRGKIVTRILTVNLKPGEGPGFARTIDEEVVPIMRRFSGFRDEIAMVSIDAQQAVGISFWDLREDEDAYSRDAYRPFSNALRST